MKSHNAGKMRFPILYRNFASADEIGKTINRSRSYVFKAMKVGFTDNEWRLLERAMNEKVD